jgi:DNA-binding MarR family transcriptional regulator
MDDDRPAWYEEVAMPALMRAARATYGAAIRVALEEVACEDVPRNGIFVIGAIARGGSPLSEIIRGLGVSKQAAGQLVDTLVVRGYLERAPDPDDRRRMTVSLTDRGQLAASASRTAIEEVDARATAEVGAERMADARAVMGAVVELGSAHQP